MPMAIPAEHTFPALHVHAKLPLREKNDRYIQLTQGMIAGPLHTQKGLYTMFNNKTSPHCRLFSGCIQHQVPGVVH